MTRYLIGIIATIAISACGYAQQLTFNGETVPEGDYLYEITTDSNIAVSGFEEGFGVIVEEGVKATLTFKDVDIDNSYSDFPPLEIREGAEVTLILDGKNKLRGGEYSAAIDVHEDATLIIKDSTNGYLYAVGGAAAAGIGGDYGFSCGRIEIHGGTLDVYGGDDGAGIGGGAKDDDGFGGDGGEVLITGGTINAYGGLGSAGIGGGFGGDGGNVVIKGGSVNAVGDAEWKAEDIGHGVYATKSGTLTCDGTNKVYAVSYTDYDVNNPPTNIVVSVKKDGVFDYEYTWSGKAPSTGICIYLPEGTYGAFVDGLDYEVMVNANGEYTWKMVTIFANGHNIKDGLGKGWTFDGKVLRIDGTADVLLSGTSSKIHVEIAGGVAANMTISNLSLTATGLNAAAMKVSNGATLNLTVIGSNDLTGAFGHAGINVTEPSTLIVTGESTGNLNANGGKFGAGIGGNNDASCGTIEIHGGNITARSGWDAAGIGAGYSASFGERNQGGVVIVYGGNVMAYGYASGAGIGGGGLSSTINRYESSASLIVYGGSVYAVGGSCAAGIGGGGKSGSSHPFVENWGDGFDVKIYGGTVYAKGGGNDIYGSSAGIGGGNVGNGGNVEIYGGSVKAIGGSGADNIGKGLNGSDSGTLTSLGQPAMLVKYPYAKQITILTSSGMYKFDGVQHIDDDYLYFYLPQQSASARLRATASTSGKVLVIESDNVYSDRIYRVDLSNGVVSDANKEDVTDELVKLEGIDAGRAGSEGAVTLSCKVSLELPLDIVKVAHGTSLEELTSNPNYLAPAVEDNGEEVTLEVEMPKKSSMGFFSLKLQ